MKTVYLESSDLFSGLAARVWRTLSPTVTSGPAVEGASAEAYEMVEEPICVMSDEIN